MLLQADIDTRLELIARRGYVIGARTAEEAYQSLKHEYEHGMFTETQIDCIIQNLSSYALGNFAQVHEGKVPCRQ